MFSALISVSFWFVPNVFVGTLEAGRVDVDCNRLSSLVELGLNLFYEFS